MGATWGKQLTLTIFGESHGPAIGIVMDGLPSGLLLDLAEVRLEMARRAPGRDEFSTPRRETDEFEILSGFFQGRTTGTPLTAVIRNQDQHSRDYSRSKDLLRPGHADFTGYIKYQGFNDYRGGGHFSGRITAPVVFAGAVAKQYLRQQGILVAAYIRSIGPVADTPLDPADPDLDRLLQVREQAFPALEGEASGLMQAAILQARAEMDSLGGVVETFVLNLPPGLGEPFFDSVESRLAHFIFAIPAVKGVEFGAGFAAAAMRGSQANDPFQVQEGRIRTRSNHHGGILGGISSGMPLVFRTAFKPTPSIAQPQQTVDRLTQLEAVLEISGRHDPCIVPRAVPVVEAAAALVIMDLLLESSGKGGI